MMARQKAKETALAVKRARRISEKQETKSEVKVDSDQEGSFRFGDTVKVFYKIKEEGKERIQPFEGILIAQKGAGVSKTITVRKIGSLGIGVERIFPLRSPNIEKIEVTRRGKVRRAKLYYLREKSSLKSLKSQ